MNDPAPQIVGMLVCCALPAALLLIPAIWAIAMNSVGTLLLIAGALTSIVRRTRVGPNAALLVGVIVIALAGTLTRVGGAESLYAGQMVGLIVLGVGMEWSNRVGYASRNSSTVAV